ncbi:uncharacterized protein ATC70_012903 [Mucor velutinosus]|uniref:Uncharacterized protein n=1 Tax=Mucor velutinosus TaxID=708070 RepID=A0AAN7HLK0_9FUNG|nr:hypothetical protein ATC70_012903 [Mucor velutinosus]
MRTQTFVLHWIKLLRNNWKMHSSAFASFSPTTSEILPAPTTPADPTPTVISLAKKPATSLIRVKSCQPPRKKFQSFSLEINDAGLAAAHQFFAISTSHGYRFV